MKAQLCGYRPWGLWGTVALELARFGNHVLGIDLDERRVSQMASALTGAIILDTTDELGAARGGAGNHDVALVAIGDDIEASILTTMNLRVLGRNDLGQGRQQDPSPHPVQGRRRSGDLPEQEMGRHIAQMLNNPAVQDYVSLGNGSAWSISSSPRGFRLPRWPRARSANSTICACWA